MSLPPGPSCFLINILTMTRRESFTKLCSYIWSQPWQHPLTFTHPFIQPFSWLRVLERHSSHCLFFTVANDQPLLPVYFPTPWFCLMKKFWISLSKDVKLVFTSKQFSFNNCVQIVGKYHQSADIIKVGFPLIFTIAKDMRNM